MILLGLVAYLYLRVGGSALKLLVIMVLAVVAGAVLPASWFVDDHAPTGLKMAVVNEGVGP